jgi:hypothetical protein
MANFVGKERVVRMKAGEKRSRMDWVGAPFNQTFI